MLRFSSGLRAALSTHYGFGAMMNRGVIYLYDNPVAVRPDDTPMTTPLAAITTNGAGFVPGTDPDNAGLLLQFVPPDGLANAGIWWITGLRSGTATWFRWLALAPDPNTHSTYYPRVDGDVGVDLIIGDPIITPATSRPLDRALFLLSN